MPLKRAAGNMYPWVTHTHSHLRGACPHRCTYCYVQAIGRRFASDRYTGPVRLEAAELEVSYGRDRTIFVEHLNDLWAHEVKDDWIDRILVHCFRFRDNWYVFQTKNPARVIDWILLPHQTMIGTTIETNRDYAVSHAPTPAERVAGMIAVRREFPAARLFVTIEPILALDVPKMLAMLDGIRPDFVNIGADSKGSGLSEPSREDVLALIDGIKSLGLELRQKRNLDRLL